MSYKKQELLALREHLGLSLVFGGTHVAHLISFLCCVICFGFFCRRPVSFVSNVASVSGLSIQVPLTFVLLVFRAIFNSISAKKSLQILKG